jgi:GNAT superfamily N-acetyltransferase
MGRVFNFPHKSFEDAPLAVEELSQNQAVALTSQILDVTVAGYSKQFEGSGKPLPEGTFAARYLTPATQERFRSERIPHVYDAGGSYYVVRKPAQGPGEEPQLVSYLKDMPAPEAYGGRYPGQQALAEVVTRPEYWGEGLASAALYARYSQFDARSDKPVALEAFYDSDRSGRASGSGRSINDWYRQLSFRADHIAGPADALEFEGGLALPCYYMTTEEGLTASGIANQLLHHTDSLGRPSGLQDMYVTAG